MIIKALRRPPRLPGTIIFILAVTGLFSYKLIVGIFMPGKPMSIYMPAIISGTGSLLIVPFMGASQSTAGFLLLCLAIILYGLFPAFSGHLRVALAAASAILLAATTFVFTRLWVLQRQRKRRKPETTTADDASAGAGSILSTIVILTVLQVFSLTYRIITPDLRSVAVSGSFVVGGLALAAFVLTELWRRRMPMSVIVLFTSCVVLFAASFLIGAQSSLVTIDMVLLVVMIVTFVLVARHAKRTEGKIEIAQSVFFLFLVVVAGFLIARAALLLVP